MRTQIKSPMGGIGAKERPWRGLVAGVLLGVGGWTAFWGVMLLLFPR